MLLSMTGFGESYRHSGHVSVRAEIKTVNNRYLKLSLKATEGYTMLESQIENLVRKYLRRGTVQINLHVTKTYTSDNTGFNESVLNAYYDQLESWRNRRGLPGFPYESLYSLPGVFDVLDNSADSSVSEDWPIIESVLAEALSKLTDMRAREGAAMSADMLANIAQIDEHLAEIRARAPEVPRNYGDKLTERINAILQEQRLTLNPADVIREIALYTDRCDISEEVVRLTCHQEQFRHLLSQSDVEGRKLDFLVQEMNRETNTIGSKANDVLIARHVIEIKSIIERIREMVQNVE